MTKSNTGVVVLSAVRTAIGSFGGTLKNFTPAELGTLCAKEAIKRAHIPLNQIGSSVILSLIHI